MAESGAVDRPAGAVGFAQMLQGLLPGSPKSSHPGPTIRPSNTARSCASSANSPDVLGTG
jgi:hypothetical protein